jgi:uncharacterized membrane protein YuzA (DUF378 family)
MMNLIIFAKLLLIIGGIAWGIYGSMGINIVKRIVPFGTLQKVVYITVGLSALMLMFNRNFYLPFLARAVVPKSLLDKDRVPINSTISIEVLVKPYSRVIYWASEKNRKKGKSKEIPVEVAYGEYANSGITTADSNGKAHLLLEKPKSYVVKRGIFKKKLRPHIHYRYTLSDGMLSQVFTKRLSKDNITKTSLCSRSSRSSKSSKSSKSSRSSISRSSFSSYKSRSSPRSDLTKLRSSPRSDLTKLRSCKCLQRYINIHEPGCKVAFIIPNHNIKMATSIISAPTPSTDNIISKKSSKSSKKSSKKYLDAKVYEVERSLDHVLQDREFSSNDNLTGIYEHNRLDNSKYSLI